jgi:hypothetical protein
MPLYEFRCCNHHVTEHILPTEHDKWQPCGGCEMKGFQIPSAFAMPCAKRENYLGQNMIVNDADDPWAGTPLEGGGEPSEKDKLTRDKAIILDMGSRTSAGGSGGNAYLSDVDRILLA